MRSGVIWAVLGVAVLAPLVGAALSPYLAFRDPIYIASGFAGIAGMGLLLMQPLLALHVLWPLNASQSKRLHRLTGVALVSCVVLHVAGLWITSPPDVVDALLFVSATPFSAWGVVAMWALFGTAALALTWRKWGMRWITWNRAHRLLAVLIAVTTLVHVALIEGTMDPISKWGLSALVIVATSAPLTDARLWRR